MLLSKVAVEGEETGRRKTKNVVFPPPPTKKRKNTKQNEKNQSGAHMLRWEMRASAVRNARILPIHPSVVSRYGRGKDAVKIPK